MASYSVSGDSDLKTRVRAETGYDDNSDELNGSDLTSIVKDTKLTLANQTGESNWYSDDGLGQALLFRTMILAKARMENMPVSAFDVANESVSARTEDPDLSAQFTQWEKLAKAGIAAMSDSQSSIPRLTSNWDF